MWNYDRYPAQLTLSMDDGRDRTLAFLPDGHIRWEGKDCEGQMMDFGEELFFLTFDPEAETRVNLTLVLDMALGLVTLVTCRQGVNPKRPTYLSTELLPGYIPLPGREEPVRRHGFTDALKGKCVKWSYEGGFSIVHVYVTERYYRIRLLQKLGDPDSPYELAMRNYTDRTEPAYYLRIRPDVVLFGFTEDNMDRVTGPEIACASRAQLIRLSTLETVGRGFGPPGKAPELFRAKGEYVEPLPGELDPGSAYLI